MNLRNTDIEANIKIQKWIKSEVVPQLIKTINMKHSSYTIKHICEKDLEFYVSNEDIKANMSLLGIKHKVVGCTGINYSYPISENFFKLKKVRNKRKFK